MGDQGPEINIRLTNPSVSIVQDVEEDLECYSRLVKLGRFGKASIFFREVLYRNLNHFAVLAEHCDALIDQGDFANAELILSHSIGRQSKSARRFERFEPDELQLLRLLLAYVSIRNGNGQQEEKEALAHARWSQTLLEIQDPRKVTDVQRQILLTRLRIHFAAHTDAKVALEELRLPWSPPPSFPEETMTISDDYLAWFEILLAQHPWDANIILQHLNELRAPSLYHQDYQVILRMIGSIFGSGPHADSQLFARMILLGTLFESATSRTWSNFHRSFSRTDMSRIWISPEVEELMQETEEVLKEHLEDYDVSETRPYKRLELLTIDHETLRDTSVEAAKITVNKALSRLDSIERFAMHSENHDHHLALEILYRYYIFTPEKYLRSVVLDKLAQYTAHFGDVPEIKSIQMLIAYDKMFMPHVRSEHSFISQVLKIRSTLQEGSCSKHRSAFENILYNIGVASSWSKPSSKILGYETRSQNSRPMGNQAPESSSSSHTSVADTDIPTSPKVSPVPSAPRLAFVKRKPSRHTSHRESHPIREREFEYSREYLR